MALNIGNNILNMNIIVRILNYILCCHKVVNIIIGIV